MESLEGDTVLVVTLDNDDDGGSSSFGCQDDSLCRDDTDKSYEEESSSDESVDGAAVKQKLAKHKYLINARATVLDQCKFLNACIETRAWEEQANWKLLKSELSTQSTIDALKKVFQKLISNFKSDTLKALRASGTDEEYGLREKLCQEICDLMKEDQVDRKELENLSSSKKKCNTDKNMTLTAKRIRDEACCTLKEKRETDTPTPVGARGGKRVKLLDVANKFREEDHVLELEKVKLERDKIALKKLKEENQREVRQANSNSQGFS